MVACHETAAHVALTEKRGKRPGGTPAKRSKSHSEKMLREPCKMAGSRSSDEIACVEELARLRARLIDFEAAHFRCVEDEKRRAVELFDRRAHDLFVSDLRALKNEPFGMDRIVGSTCLGAAYFAELWSGIAETLASGGPGPTLGQMQAVVLAEGSPWRADRIRVGPAHLMACYARMCHDPEKALEKWVAATPEADREEAAIHARWHLDQTPDADAARQELTVKAQQEASRWALRHQELREDYETARASAVDRAVGVGQGDKALANELRILNRYLTTTRSRIDKLERRLDHLSKSEPAACRSSEWVSQPVEPARSAAFDLTNEVPNSIDPHDPVSRLDAQSGDSATDGQSPQMSTNKDDVFQLRIENPTCEVDREQPSDLPKGLQRELALYDLQRVRKVDWSDPNQINPSDVVLLRKLERMPAGKKRDALIRLTFGSEAKFRSCSRQFRFWVLE